MPNRSQYTKCLDMLRNSIKISQVVSDLAIISNLEVKQCLNLGIKNDATLFA